ncbi:3-isopropylmalate dehydrogenase [Vampirovibrio chlorellavorus]|uniref:3-isopropylmalate dehydrogenase n=1 Tax=Vampirovibrio chlorellavorus TaxID=758823 RepID=UPI0026ED5D30|nr:3-isopropylmalate dehydrogenase [Vampirovibrio chlorellavorus]
MSPTHKIAVLPGDGIGPEIMEQAVKVLKAVEQKFNLRFELTYAPMGGAGIEAAGVPLPPETLKLAQESDAVLMGSVGDFKYDTLDPKIRPEQGLLQIRKALGLYANLRPVKGYKCLAHVSTLKPEVVTGIDVMVIRELTGGIYFGQPRAREGSGSQEKAYDTLVYTQPEIERIARIGFESARSRRKQLMSVDKANVLASSQLWRDVVNTVAKDYPDVALSHMYVDNAAMQLILNPRQFDVILTENMFGDILSDEASMLTGSLGMLPSASLGERKASGQRNALYEPSHGSAPQFAGQNKVNPIATILSLAMMLEYSFGYAPAASQIDAAIEQVLEAGYRTFDIMGEGATEVGTAELGDRIAAALLALPTPVAV